MYADELMSLDLINAQCSNRETEKNGLHNAIIKDEATRHDFGLPCNSTNAARHYIVKEESLKKRYWIIPSFSAVDHSLEDFGKQSHYTYACQQNNSQWLHVR